MLQTTAKLKIYTELNLHQRYDIKMKTSIWLLFSLLLENIFIKLELRYESQRSIVVGDTAHSTLSCLELESRLHAVNPACSAVPPIAVVPCEA